jgi:hypothetical protein
MRLVRQFVRGHWRAGLLLATGALVALAFTTPVIAGMGQEDGVAPAAISAGGGTINQVISVTEQNALSTTSINYVNLPGATANISVATQNALIMARFSGESACSGGGAVANFCRVRILLNGIEMNPVVNLDFAFDSTNNGAESPFSWESHSIDRSRRVAPGNYVVQVQVSTTNVATTFRLDDWALTVERAQP